MTWPSLTGLLTTNGAAGGAALVRVSGMLPVLRMSKVLVTDCPTATCPKSVVAGVTVSCAWPVMAVPVRPTVAVPLWPVTESVPVLPPAVVGAYATCTVTDCCGCTEVPAAGRPVAVNGASGAPVAETVSGCVPVLVNVTPRVLTVPVATSPKASDVGRGTKPALVPYPVRSRPIAPRSVVKVSTLPAGPGVVGANATWTA